MRVLDPLTRKTIEWTTPPLASPYAVPLSACTDDRSVARWIMPWELPDLTAVDGAGNMFIAGKAWQAANFALWKFNSSGVFQAAFPTGNFGAVNVSDNLIGAMHRGTALAYSADDERLEFVITTGQQGGSTVRLYTLADGGTSLVKLGDLDYAGHTVNSSGFTAASAGYMPKLILTEDETRVLSGAFRTTDGNFHSLVFTKAGFATTSWTMVPFIFKGSGANTQVTQLGTDGSSTSTAIVAVFGGMYGNDRLGIAFTLDNGSNWFFLTPEGAVAVPEGGMDEAEFEAGTGTGLTERGYILADDDKVYCPGRVLVSGVLAFVSLIEMTATNPFLDPSGNVNHYILGCNLASGTYALHGPYFAGQSGWFSAMDMELASATRLRFARLIPQTGQNPDGAVLDYPNGGPTIGIYEQDIVSIGTGAPTLVNTLNLPAGGSRQRYLDRIWGWYPYHEQSYGDGQCFIGCRWVKGAAGKLAVNISDQRVQDVYNCFHMSRMAILDATE